MTKDHRYSVQPKSGEPWVSIPDAKDFDGWGHDQTVMSNQINRQTEKYRTYISIFDFLQENRIDGDYHEFGCHRGRTFRMALSEARRQNMEGMRFYAYDSFEGLPPATSDPDQELWRQPGALATGEEDFLDLIREHGIYVDRVETIKGYYSDSLTAAQQNKVLETGRKV